MQSLQSLDSSVRLTLRLALAGQSSVILLAVFFLLFASQYLGERLDTVYADRVVPLHDLQRVGYVLNVALPSAMADPSAAAMATVAASWREVDGPWQQYLATFLTPEEAALAHKTGEQLTELRHLGYPGALGQVLSNLVINAVVHGLNRRNGKVRITLASSDGDPLELNVIDNGVGMSPAVQKRSFEPFFSTRLGPDGSGLGLSIVRNIVVGVLGGQISLRSGPGQGSCFVLQLPSVAPGAAALPDFGEKVIFAHEPVALA